MKKDYGTEIDSYFSKVKTALDRISRQEINKFIELLLAALDGGKQVFIMGNGGSGATASHFACDFNKGLSYGKAKRFRFICLNDNQPTFSAYANDVGYESVFAEQLRNFLEEGDLVIAISGSGNSPNVLKAVDYANGKGAITFGLVGFDGGALRKAARHSIHVAVDDMQVTEDVHMILDHLLYSILNLALPGER